VRGVREMPGKNMPPSPVLSVSFSLQPANRRVFESAHAASFGFPAATSKSGTKGQAAFPSLLKLEWRPVCAIRYNQIGVPLAKANPAPDRSFAGLFLGRHFGWFSQFFPGTWRCSLRSNAGLWHR